jgi:hypothetical protein
VRAPWERMIVGSVIAMVLLGAPLGVRAQEDGTASERALETYEAMKDYAFARKEEAAAWLNERLTDLDGQIAALREEGQAMSDRAQAEGQEVMDHLSEQRDEAARQLERLQGASVDACEGIKQASIAAFTELEEAVGQVRSHFE